VTEGAATTPQSEKQCGPIVEGRPEMAKKKKDKKKKGKKKK